MIPFLSKNIFKNTGEKNIIHFIDLPVVFIGYVKFSEGRKNIIKYRFCYRYLEIQKSQHKNKYRDI